MSEEPKRKRGRPTKEDNVRKRYDENQIKKPHKGSLTMIEANKDKNKPGRVSEMLMHSAALRKMGKVRIDTSVPEEIEDRVDQYLTYCIEHNMKPTVESMSLAFGIDRTTLWRWKEGHMEEMPEASVQAVRDGYNLMNEILAQCLVDGAINPVAAFFLLKNNHGYRDQTDVVVTANNPYDAANTSDVRNKYIEGVTAISGEGLVE